jgi:uncharacterized protein YdhG (YjbR/CyaY superfamily)
MRYESHDERLASPLPRGGPRKTGHDRRDALFVRWVCSVVPEHVQWKVAETLDRERETFVHVRDDSIRVWERRSVMHHGLNQPQEVDMPARRAPAKAKTVNEYLAALPADQRRTLARMRALIKAAAPGTTEGISYGMPTYKLDGRPVVYFGAAAEHVSLYAVSDKGANGKPLPELAKYDTSGKGTVRFPSDKPPPGALVTKLVRANVARVRGRAASPTRVRSSNG